MFTGDIETIIGLKNGLKLQFDINERQKQSPEVFYKKSYC